MSGTQGYAEEAEAFLRPYDSLRFEDVQGWLTRLLPRKARG